MPRARSVADRPRRFGAAFLLSCLLHAAMVAALAFAPRPFLDADGAPSRGPFAAAPVGSDFVEMALVAPPVGPTRETTRSAIVAPTIEPRGDRRAVAPAVLAEVASRSGGRTAGPRHRRAVPEASPPAVVAAAAVEEPRDPADALNDPEGEIAAAPSSSPPVGPAPADVSQPQPMAVRAATPASPAGGGAGEPGMDGDRGEGDGQRTGGGRGVGEVTSEAWGKELRARILGDVHVELPPPDGRRVISHEQATALRVRDVFPRMPEALWPGWRPYVVTLAVCVDEQGGVAEVDVLSAAAPRLDQMVAAAARTWRYRPLVLAGVATAFCHAVVIKYEPW